MGGGAMKLLPRGPEAGTFLAMEGLLWVVFLALDLAERDTTLLKYAAIALCLRQTLRQAAGGGERLVAAAMALTLGADTFLLLLNRCYPLGITLFIGVQGLYLLRLARANGGRTLWPLRLVLFAAALGALKALGLLEPVNVLALFYFSNFAVNVLLSFGPRGAKWRLFSTGLALFLCCDLCVGAFNQPGLIPAALYGPVRLGMWFFYLPAQALIALSGHPDMNKEGECL